MKKHIKNFLLTSKKIKKEWILCFLLGIGFIVACQGALEEGNPFGPSNSKVVISPSSPKINKGGTLNFAAFGGTLPLSWSLSANVIGAIDAGTGIFTSNPAAPGPQVAGTATVTVVDAVGDTDTATITVLPNPLNIAPGSSTQMTPVVEEVFVVAGGSGAGLTATCTSDNSAYTCLGKVTLTPAAAQVTVGFATPTLLEGDTNLTITITDTENGDTGSVVLKLIALLQ